MGEEPERQNSDQNDRTLHNHIYPSSNRLEPVCRPRWPGSFTYTLRAPSWWSFTTTSVSHFLIAVAWHILVIDATIKVVKGIVDVEYAGAVVYISMVNGAWSVRGVGRSGRGDSAGLDHRSEDHRSGRDGHASHRGAHNKGPWPGRWSCGSGAGPGPRGLHLGPSFLGPWVESPLGTIVLGPSFLGPGIESTSWSFVSYGPGAGAPASRPSRSVNAGVVPPSWSVIPLSRCVV